MQEMRRTVKEMVLAIGGKLASCLDYYFAIIESKWKEEEVSHFQDTETEAQRVCMVFLRHTDILKRPKSKLFP